MTTETQYLFSYRTAHPFSNFHPSKFVVDGQLFHCAEQYIMYRKALEFGDQDSARRMLDARTPAECKRLGRQVRGFDERRWLEVREQIAFDAAWHKFAHNRKLRDFLLETGDLELVEASPTDRIWGIGYAEQNAPDHQSRWGLNILGKALTQVRQKLRLEQ